MIHECYPGIYQYTLQNSVRVGISEIQIYLIPGRPGQRSLMIDAGFDQPHCMEITKNVLKEMNISFHELDVFLTHEHPDHSGLISALQKEGARILLNPDEEFHHYDCLNHHAGIDAIAEEVIVLRSMGIDPKRTPKMWEFYENQIQYEHAEDAGSHGVIARFAYRPIYPGQVLYYGNFVFHVIGLQGHSYGQSGLYDEEHRILFPADQVLNRICPIVSTSFPNEYLMSSYFNSLIELKTRFQGWTVFPAHGGPIEELGARTEEIAEFYMEKIEETAAAIEQAEEAVTVYEAALLVFRGLRIPTNDREFLKVASVVTRTFSCLEYLYERHHLIREERNGMLFWRRIEV